LHIEGNYKQGEKTAFRLKGENRVKREAFREKIIANEATDKELISKIYKQLL